jgi:NAD(P)-dependent dehydrogenase (short-subunit alcohol dehydrogenase family)
MPKTILITGASTGFGRDTAETLAGAGHSVFAAMRETEAKNREHAAALQAKGIAVVDIDVLSDAAVERGVGEVLARAGRIDVLVNNAGILAAGLTEAFAPEQARLVLDTNVLGVLRTTRAVLPAMRRQHDGLIVTIGSVLGRVTLPFFGIYGASKFALEALTDSLRYEVSQLGIEIVLVQPSAYPTPTYAKMLQPDLERAASYGAVGEIPGRMFADFAAGFAAPDAPNPHDVAAAIANLLAQPKGSRPARLVVGAPYGADAVNAQTAPVQKGVVEAIGLGHLARLA